MGRVLEVKCLLIELNRGVSFVNLDDILVDLKLAPDVLEVPVPKYFIEDHARALEEREKLLDVLQLQASPRRPLAPPPRAAPPRRAAPPPADAAAPPLRSPPLGRRRASTRRRRRTAPATTR